MFKDLGGSELLIIVVVVALLFGSKRMPDAARGLGRSLRIFKAETKGLTSAQTGDAEITSTQLANDDRTSTQLAQETAAKLQSRKFDPEIS
jgi:sec-independent protein translocase protein TatA